MPIELFNHMLLAVGQEPEDNQLGVGQFYRPTGPILPGAHVETPFLSYYQRGYQAAQPQLSIEALAKQLLSVTASQGSNTRTKVIVEEIIGRRYALVTGPFCGYKSGNTLVEVACQPKLSQYGGPQTVTTLPSGLLLKGYGIQAWGVEQENALMQLLDKAAPISNGNPFARVTVEGYLVGQEGQGWGVSVCGYKSGYPPALIKSACT
jgi:hypothetical protein